MRASAGAGRRHSPPAAPLIGQGPGAWLGPRGDWARERQRRHRRGDWARAAAGGGARSFEARAGCMGRRRRRADLADAAGALPEAIAALSRTLPAGPSPEIFRRAKFDRPEAAPALWRLLFRVLSLPRADGAPAPRALGPDFGSRGGGSLRARVLSLAVAAPGAGLLPAEAQARWVKAALLAQGYPRLGLARLPDDGSQGSRELLLALSWLLAREPLLERLLAQTRVRLGDEMPVFECGAMASPGLPAPRVEADGPVDARHLQWLMGKLRFRWRNLMASQQEQCALLGKIHTFTRGCHSDRSLGHLSAAETELLRDPEGGRQLLRRLESENARLEAALEWRRRELVFWQWMDTVLGACPPEASQPAFPPGLGGPGAGPRRGTRWRGSCRPCRRSSRRQWPRRAPGGQVGGQGPEWSAARQAAQEAVCRELAALRRAWERGGGRAQPHGALRLVRTEAAGPGGPGLRAAEAIGALRSREACLEATLHRLQAQCRQQLARLAGALPGLLWIPPPRR
ncbi:hypothetical protein QTO34_020199 [Cnephaeus nilssonii]|uniref:Tubulin epsilon and delta complex protein 1 domain-containing protein n=1 Tax=Cnephaeus nilssonii TaxID=3371016 RepID=A0AA40HYU7_CNENI|nr:hypothetical protein QTO34_020199 [Eptesicus nilssonii]